MAKETEVAKKLLAEGKKAGALICLKKKKLQQSMLDKSQAQLENVSTMVRRAAPRRAARQRDRVAFRRAASPARRVTLRRAQALKDHFKPYGNVISLPPLLLQSSLRVWRCASSTLLR